MVFSKKRRGVLSCFRKRTAWGQNSSCSSTRTIEQSAKGATAAFEEGERLNSVLSDYESSSELTWFSESSRTGEKFMLSQDLFEVLSHSQGLAKETEGCFDATIGPFQAMADCPFPRKKTARRQIGRRLAKSRLSKSEPFGRGSLGDLEDSGHGA